jgi:hypothetical protein
MPRTFKMGRHKMTPYGRFHHVEPWPIVRRGMMHREPSFTKELSC